MSALPSALRLTSCCCCCCWLLLICLVVFLIPAPCTSDTPRQIASRARKQSAGDDNAAAYKSSYLDDDAEVYEDEQISTEKGQYLGSPCDVVCNSELQNVFCDSITGLCECEKFYPVRLGPTKGCAKPKKLGEQCFYRATCTFTDQHSTCTQVQHNAVCDCEEGYHRVALSRPNKKVFCAEDLVLITTDLPTLLCIASGIAIFTAMICFVLKLFSRARYSRPRHYANANHAPPMLFSSDTGSRRPSLASVHSSTSSSRSYSARRLEKERNDKEQRQAIQELRLAKQQREQLQQLQQQQQQVVPTPSPRTPHSTDELLPSVEEGQEVFYNEQVPTTSDVSDTIPITTTMTVIPTTTLTTAITKSNASTTRMREQPETAPMATPTTIFGTSVAPRASDDIFQV